MTAALPVPQHTAMEQRALAPGQLRRQHQIARAFEGEEYERRHHKALASIAQQLQELLKELQAFVAERDFALEITTTGFITVPMRNGRRLLDEEKRSRSCRWSSSRSSCGALRRSSWR